MAKSKSWRQLVEEADKDREKKDDAYIFSNNRKFKDKKKGVVLNKTNAVRIMSVYGSDSSQWLGKEIFLFSEPTDFNGQSVKAVRVRVPLPTHTESESESNW